MNTHILPPGAFTREQIEQFAQAAQQDSVVRGYWSFVNLSEGKAVCVLEAPDKEAVAAWFEKKKMSYDSINRVELEGDSGVIKELLTRSGGSHDFPLNIPKEVKHVITYYTDPHSRTLPCR